MVMSVPASPGGFTGTYSLTVVSGATLTATGARVTRIQPVIDGVLETANGLSSIANGDYEFIGVNTRVSLSAASSHTVSLVGCASAAGVTAVANTGTLVVTASK